MDYRISVNIAIAYSTSLNLTSKPKLYMAGNLIY
jgi:hypothetical protein